MKVDLWIVLVCVGFGYFVLPFILWLLKDKKGIKPAIIVILLVYLAVLLAGVLGSVSIGKSVGFAFDFSSDWCNKHINFNLDVDKVDLLINLTMLIPIGLVLVFFSKKKSWKLLLCLFLAGACSGATIEVLQFILPVYRSVQLSDVILNAFSVLIGGLLGLFYHFICKKLLKR